MIRAMKLEQQGVFVMNDKSEEWTKATPEYINSIEDLLRRVENLPFSNRDIKENVVFEKEFNIGLGSVKSFKDEDGDLVYTFHKDASKSAIEIDEDFEFESGNRSEKSISNYWVNEPSVASSIRTEISKIEKQPPLKDTIVKERTDDIKKERKSDPPSVVSNDHDVTELLKHKFVNTKIQKAKNISPDYTFAKRGSYKKNNVYKRALTSMLQDIKSEIKAPKSSGVIKYDINYMKKKSNPVVRKDGGIVSSIIRYNRIRNLEDTVDSLFYLDVVKTSKLTDEAFDQLLDNIVAE